MISSLPIAAYDGENTIRSDKVKKIMCGRDFNFPYAAFAVYEESGTGKKLSQGRAQARNMCERL
jgi:hypothetical protein